MTKIKPLLSVLLILGLCNACALRRTNQENDTPEQESSEAKPAPEASEPQAATHVDEAKPTSIESMSTALSRTQARLEELDAKISALTDKLDATRVTVDNLAGSPAVSTQVIGAAAKPEHAEHLDAAEKPAVRKTDDSGANAQFRSAAELLKHGKYSDAVLAFNSFSNTNPDHVLAGSAHYHAGEAYMQMGENKLALAEYSKVVTNYPSSPRVPSALVRVSQCYAALGNNAESSRTLAMASDLYPGNPSLDLIAPHRAESQNHAANSPEASPAVSPMEPKAGAVHEEEHEEVND